MMSFNEWYTIMRNRGKRLIPYITGTLVISTLIPLVAESWNKGDYLNYSEIIFKSEIGREPLSNEELSNFNCKKLNLQEDCAGLSNKVLEEVIGGYGK